MKNILILVVASVLAGCGGGGDGTNGPATPGATPPTSVATVCGIQVGPKLLQGSVTAVHDGDTLTLSVAGVAYKVRLDSIDAPELAQPFGDVSQSALSNSVLGKSVKVAYAKTDPYDRVVGAVFTDSCQYVNLSQVATGMAWFYKAYQCEVGAPVRQQFIKAQDQAVAARSGLWSQSSPEAPWFYRNGTEPVTPTCKSDLPAWAGTTALTAVGATTAANSSTPVTGSSGTDICYTGPRGGTYTLTASGSKNYGGC